MTNPTQTSEEGGEKKRKERPLTQMDKAVLDFIGADRWTIGEIYRFYSVRNSNLDKVSKSLDKLVRLRRVKLEGKKYSKTHSS